MFESRTDPLASRFVFARRVIKFASIALAVCSVALGIGILGYHFIAKFSWIDSLLNASMILGGMGPMGDLPSDAAKVFASFYALFSGLVFISVMGIVLAPAAHRALHLFHLEEEDQKIMSQERVVIVGASDNPERYSHRALRLLRQHGHAVVPVHPRLAEIEGIPVVSDLGGISGPVDTVTMYVGAAISAGLQDKLIALKPHRVIFNPGAENAALAEALQTTGIACEEACTLVLLNTGQF